MSPGKGRPRRIIPPPLPPRVTGNVCAHCGERPVEYRVDTHGTPTLFGTCRACHERFVYLEARDSFDAR